MNIDLIMESIAECIVNQLNKLENVDTKELGDAMDMLKDLSMAKYYCSVSKAMEEKSDTYGEEWDENGPIKHYRMTPKMYRDNDLRMDKMYYTEPVMGQSKYEVMKHNYVETKETNPENRQDHMKNLEHWMNALRDDIKEMLPKMSTDEKATARNVISSWTSMLV